MSYVDDPSSALLYIDFMVRFGHDKDVVRNMAGVSGVIRDLMRRLEEQAMRMEKAEMKKGAGE
jgi:hypothetical protein